MSKKNQTRETYNLIAEKYHTMRQSDKKNSWNDNIESPAMDKILVDLVKDKLVLDLGCGTGLLTYRVKSWGGIVTGIDQAEGMLCIAKKLCPDTDFIQASAVSLPFRDSSFDVVVSSLVLHYIKDLSVVFKEVSRILSSGGVFVFSMHHPVTESILREKTIGGEKVSIAPYFHSDSYSWKMCDTEFISYHHTFEDIVSGLGSVGLLTEKLVECRPIEESAKCFEDYEFANQFPTFCIVKSKKE